MALGHSNNPLLIGSKHIKLSRIHSTNKYATEIVSKSKPIEGTVISASFQYDGRGQIGRFWESEEGKNILCSTILRPLFLLAHDQFRLNMAISLAISDFVKHFLPNENEKVKIKWPNDIYVNDQKIAGILIQNTLKGKFISSSVLGTGINVNQIHFSDKIPNPTSLKKLIESETDMDEAFVLLFQFMSNRYHQLVANEIEQLEKEYLASLYRIDEWSSFEQEDKSSFKGKIKGVDDIGQLIIELETGDKESYAFREIKFVI